MLIRYFVAFLFLLMIVNLQKSDAQPDSPPTSIQESFQQAFPNASQVHWVKQNDRIYLVHFQSDSMNKTAAFNERGTLLTTKYPIAKETLPQPVFTKIKGKQAKTILKQESVTGAPTYEVHLQQQDSIHKVRYNPNGTLIQTR